MSVFITRKKKEIKKEKRKKGRKMLNKLNKGGVLSTCYVAHTARSTEVALRN